jgi:hypothetical protein
MRSLNPRSRDQLSPNHNESKSCGDSLLTRISLRPSSTLTRLTTPPMSPESDPERLNSVSSEKKLLKRLELPKTGSFVGTIPLQHTDTTCHEGMKNSDCTRSSSCYSSVSSQHPPRDRSFSLTKPSELDSQLVIPVSYPITHGMMTYAGNSLGKARVLCCLDVNSLERLKQSRDLPDPDNMLVECR